MTRCFAATFSFLVIAATACGGPDAAPSRGPSSPPSPAPSTSAAGATGAVDFEDTTCVLRAGGGTVTAECTGSALTCAEIARGELVADRAGAEVVAICQEGDDEPMARALVIAHGDDVLWTLPVTPMAVRDRSWDCMAPPRVTPVVVDALGDGRGELLVRMRECIGAGEQSDLDVLWQWRDGDMVAVADAALDCQYMGDTSDPEAPPPPAAETYDCTGGYLDVGAAVTLLSAEAATFADERGDDGRMRSATPWAPRPLRWDASAARFVPAP